MIKVPMIEVEGAGFFFSPERWVFRNHDLCAERGEVVAILGPNGRGKTTLLKALLGLIRLKEGRVDRRGHAGYVPQAAQAPFPYSAFDMVLMGRARHIGTFGAPTRADLAFCRRAMQRLGIEGFADRCFDDLSGGERQLVTIARALASECQALVLDEPTSALDFRNQNLVLSILADLAARDGMAVVFTTHFPQHALHLADRVLMMFGPEDYLFGPRDAVMTDANLSRLYGMEVRNVAYGDGCKPRRTVVPVFA